MLLKGPYDSFMEKSKRNYQIISGSALKVIATAAMLIDHIAAVLLRETPIELLTIMGRSITLYAAMRFIGRIAFPIFAFLITEGYLHTRNRMRYGASLALFALLSEIPWNLEHTGKILALSSRNVFFTLLLGYLAICMLEKWRSRPSKQAAWLLGLLAVSVILRADYGISGYVFILFLYVMRERPLLRAVIGSGILPARWEAGLAFIPIALYNGKRGFARGSFAKYFFYFFYPAHLFALYLIKKATIGY